MASAPGTQAPPCTAEEEAATPNEKLTRTSLYVGDLHPKATEMDLMEAFSRVAPVASVRVCRDRTRLLHNSLGYAYVNFFYPSDASKALACLNHSELRGRPMRIMWCQRDPLTRKTGIGNLYVKNLDPSVTSARLEELFSQYGTVLSCKVAAENGVSMGYGFVQFDSKDSAMTAIDALHGTLLEGKNLYVSKFIKKSDREGSNGEMFTKLYVKNLNDDLTEGILKEKFSEHGKVCNAVIMKDHHGKSKGFGFIEFNTHQEARKAMEALNGVQTGSNTLFVGRAQKKAERKEIWKQSRSFTFNSQKNLNLYVKNLGTSIDDWKLKEIFSPYGKVTSAKVMRDNRGVSKGFGFVSFTNVEEAKKALNSLNGKIIQGLSLYVALKQRWEERSMQLQNHHSQYLPFNNSNWNIVTPRYQTPHYTVFPCPPLTIPYLSLLQPLMDPNFDRYVTAFYPYGVHSHWGNHSAFVPLEGLKQENTKNFDLPHKQVKSDTKSYGSARDCNSRTWKAQKLSRKWEVKNTWGLGNKSSGKSVTTRSSPGMCKKNTGEVFQPLIDIVELEHEAKATGLLLEMSKSNAQQLLNSPNSLGRQVEKAVQMLNSASSESS